MQQIYEPSEDSFLIEGCLRGYAGIRALDMGTGSGMLARTLSKSFKEVIAVDINPLARERVKGVKNCRFVLSDLFRNVKGRFDLIVFNPPYLPEDDGDLRYAAGRGGKVIKRFFKEARTHLYGNGKIIFLLSSFSPVLPEDIEALGYEVHKMKEKRTNWEALTVYEASYSRELGLHLARGFEKLVGNLGF